MEFGFDFCEVEAGLVTYKLKCMTQEINKEIPTLNFLCQPGTLMLEIIIGSSSLFQAQFPSSEFNEQI
jgi:hypothetical protein